MLFLNAFVDLGHKIVIQNTVFKVYDGQTQIILIAIVNAMILLPYVLLFTPAAFLSDRFQFIKVMRFSAWLATVIACFICYFYYAGEYKFAFAMTMVLAVQSTLYSPAKYGYIRQLVGEKRLTEGNALVQATTIISILVGTIVFSILFEHFLSGRMYQNEADILRLIAPAAWLLILSSLAELVTAYRLPVGSPRSTQKGFQISAYLSGSTLKSNLALVTNSKVIWCSIAGLSVFWGLSQMVLASFPAYAKAHLGEFNTVVIQGVIGASGIGILLGSLLVTKISKGKIEMGLIPLGAVGVACAFFLMPFSDSKLVLACLFFFIGLFGAFLIAPLNALIQSNAPTAKLGTVLAANNWLQNISMLLFLVITISIALTGLDSLWLLYFMSTVALVGALASFIILLRPFLQLMLTGLFKLRYNVVSVNEEAFPKNGSILLLGNHVSWIDWALVQMAVGRPITFVIDRIFYDFWLLHWILKKVGTVPISPTKNTQAIKEIHQALKQNGVICLFPEGGISPDGELQEIKRGFELILKKSGAMVSPFIIHGMSGSIFARDKPKRNWLHRRKIRVMFHQALNDETSVVELETALRDLESLSAV